MKRVIFTIVALTCMINSNAFAGENMKITPMEEGVMFEPIVLMPPPREQSEETIKLIESIAANVKGLFTSESNNSFSMDFRLGMQNLKIYHKPGKNKVTFVNRFGYPFINVYQDAVQFYSPTKNTIKEYNKNYSFKFSYTFDDKFEEKVKELGDDFISAEQNKFLLARTIEYSKSSVPRIKINIDLSRLILQLKDFTGMIIQTDETDNGREILKIEAHRRKGGKMMKVGLDKKTKKLVYCRFYMDEIAYIAINNIDFESDIPDSEFEVDNKAIEKISAKYENGLEINNAVEFKDLVDKGYALTAIDDFDESMTADYLIKLEGDFEKSKKFFVMFEPKYAVFLNNVVKVKEEEEFLKHFKEINDFIDNESYALDKDRNKVRAFLYYNLSQFYAVDGQIKKSLQAINKSIKYDPAAENKYRQFKGQVIMYEKQQKEKKKKEQKKQ